jgi:hypothetical protein
MSIPRVGGTAPKWDRLHEQEMREVKTVFEHLAGKEMSSLEMSPMWEVLSRWARHRYKVCRNANWQDEKKRRGGRLVAPSEVLPAAPVASVVIEVKAEEGDGLPW